MSENKQFVIKSNGLLENYYGKEDVVVIPEGVKIIGGDAFKYRYDYNPSKIIIPEGVTEIKGGAFYCYGVSEVILPKTLEIIGEGAFLYCALKRIEIPNGVKIIPRFAFHMSELEEITIPDSVVEIGEGAFQGCRALRKINISDLESVKIGAQAFAGCASLVDEDGWLILNNRLLTYHTDIKDKYVVIPKKVSKIDAGAFDSCRRVHLEMSIDCPNWENIYGKKSNFASSIINASGSTISFRDDNGEKVALVVLADKNETPPKQKRSILSLKTIGGRFDFAGYDSNFENLANPYNKTMMALARIQYPYELSEEMKTVYQDYLKKHAKAAGIMLIDEDRLDILEKLGEKKFFTARVVKSLIDYAIEKDKVEFIAWLIDYNKTNYGEVKRNSISLGGRTRKQKLD